MQFKTPDKRSLDIPLVTVLEPRQLYKHTRPIPPDIYMNEDVAALFETFDSSLISFFIRAKIGGKYCNGNIAAVPGEEGNLGVIGAIPEIYKGVKHCNSYYTIVLKHFHIAS